MPTLQWSEEITLEQAQMDQTHMEFVELLGAAEEALTRSPEEGLAAYDRLVEHTVGHFDQENRWMAATGFAPENCHAGHHAQVLELMQEVSRVARQEADYGPLGRMIPELANWFVQHALTMDTALATHLLQIGFDPVSGHIANPVTTAAISGCGGACAPEGEATAA